MLYDELVPKGEYLAHYGVPKDQWSPEAKARHNRRHPNKTIDPVTIARGFLNVRDTYQEDNYNRGGNRSTFGSKVDEHRFQLAEARRRNSGNEGKKPNGEQRVPEYRKPRTSSYKTPGANAKPGRGRSSGKPTSSNSGYDPMRARFTRTPDPSSNEVEAERRTNASIRPNRSAGKKPSSGKTSSRSYKPTPNSQSADRAIATAISSYNLKGNGAKSTPRVTKGNSSWDRAVKDKLKEQDRPNTTPAVSKTKKKFATSQELRPWPEQSTTSGKKPAQSTDNGWTKPKPTNKPKSKDINKKKKKQTNTK